MIDKITEALDDGIMWQEYSLTSQRPLIRWIIKYYFTSYLIVELGDLLLIGLKVTYLTGANSLHTTALPQLQNQPTVVFPGIDPWSIVVFNISYLYNVCQESVPILFADDTNLFYSGSSLDDLVRRINDELCNISTWLKVNKLSLNIKQTHYIIFHRKRAYFCTNQNRKWNRWWGKTNQVSRCCHRFKVILEKTYCTCFWKTVAKHWYDD